MSCMLLFSLCPSHVRSVCFAASRYSITAVSNAAAQAMSPEVGDIWLASCLLLVQQMCQCLINIVAVPVAAAAIATCKTTDHVACFSSFE